MQHIMSCIMHHDIGIANHSSTSESESPWASRANNDPSSAPTTIKKKIKLKLKRYQKRGNDARPVGGRRPRYAASGEATTCAGDGEGGSEPVEEPKEISGEVGEEDARWLNVSVYDCARPRGSVDGLPAPATPQTPPAAEEVEKANWRCGVVFIFI
jgi:hypothetical protein